MQCSIRWAFTDVHDLLTRQFDTACKLCTYHLSGLTTAECLWRPAVVGLHVQRQSDGTWTAEWPEHEGYELGPPSIAWLTWHIGFWWSMVLDHCAGQGILTRERILWPGDAGSTCAWISDLERQWRRVLGESTDDDLRSTARTKWPFQARPFGDVVTWVNIELTKNAAEIGYARFLYAVRNSGIDV
jgi:hypothetical protein